MAGISTSLAIQDKFSNTLNRATQGLNRVMKAMNAVDVASLDVAPAKLWRDAQKAIDTTQKELQQYAKQLDEANRKADKHSDIWSKAKGAIAGVFAAQSLQKVIDLADQTTSTNARLGLMAGEGESVEELNKKIMASAQRSRAAYQTTADAISKMGIMARDAFGSNDELIQFTELINKQFTIAGTEAAGIDAAMLQLTQAMSSGVLRGEELNSVFEQAPTIIQTIADYLGKPVGEIRSMAAEGQITSTIVKNAMLSSADEINARFESMPMTFAQVGEIVKNKLLKTFMPVIQAIGRGANFINDNWATIEPILVGIAAGATVAAVAYGVYTAATWLQVAANRALLVSMMSNPFTLTAAAIALVVGMIYKWVQSVGGIKVAWLIFCNEFLSAWDAVKIGFMQGVYRTMNFADQWGLFFTLMGANIGNIMGDMKVNVLNILQSMVNGAIDIINKFIATLNKIPGVSIGTIDHVSFGTQAALAEEANKAAREQKVAEKRAENAQKAAERAADINAMQIKSDTAAIMRQVEINQNKADAAANATDSIDSIGSVGEVGKINSDVNIADEDIKLMKDVAEMRYVQNFVTLTPNVAMEAHVTKDADFDAFYNQFGERITEELIASAEGVY